MQTGTGETVTVLTDPYGLQFESGEINTEGFAPGAYNLNITIDTADAQNDDDIPMPFTNGVCNDCIVNVVFNSDADADLFVRTVHLRGPVL